MNTLFDDEPRHERHNREILNTLKQRPMKLSELRALSANHTARISEIRKQGEVDGFEIVCERHGADSTYRLKWNLDGDWLTDDWQMNIGKLESLGVRIDAERLCHQLQSKVSAVHVMAVIRRWVSQQLINDWTLADLVQRLRKCSESLDVCSGWPRVDEVKRNENLQRTFKQNADGSKRSRSEQQRIDAEKHEADRAEQLVGPLVDQMTLEEKRKVLLDVGGPMLVGRFDRDNTSQLCRSFLIEHKMKATQ